MAEVLGIEILNRTETKRKEELALLANNVTPGQQQNTTTENENANNTPQEVSVGVPKTPAEDTRSSVEKEACL